MKELIVVSKTHLDLGFTDFVENILRKYIEEYIPSAIDIAKKLNTSGDKKFVWTTGSWILTKALKSSDEQFVYMLKTAIKNGDIVAHAMPFTTHTELLDSDLLEYGLSLVDEIDAISGKKTIAAKMTDVPGHTCAIVPFLARRGVKLLHIGVNGASAIPDVPECFLWKCGGEEIVVIYSGDYGGVFKSEYIDDILYFDHTLDNRGTKSPEAINKKLNLLKKKYPDYNVRAGRMDDIALSLWNVRDKLPVIESEIGDTWIHGVATDPYKVGAYRTLSALKNKWLADGTLDKSSHEYTELADNLLCIAEHTWGMDAKTHFGDMENYLKRDFVKARLNNIVKVKNPFGYFPNSFQCFINQMFGNDKLKYSTIEESWREQRRYIDNAISSLSSVHFNEAASAISLLRPTQISELKGENYTLGQEIKFKDKAIIINSKGGITLTAQGIKILDSADLPLIEYRSYGYSDYKYWLDNYTRDYNKTRGWSVGDFARPALKRYDKKFKQGLFNYSVCESRVLTGAESLTIHLRMNIEQYANEELGAPYEIMAVYQLTNDKLALSVEWLKKDAARTTESIALRLYPASDTTLRYVKLGQVIAPDNIVSKGGRKLMAVEKTLFDIAGKEYSLICKEAPLIATDGGNILHFDNQSVNDASKGVAYILYNNVWGTNFPLWYEDSAMFNIEIEI